MQSHISDKLSSIFTLLFLLSFNIISSTIESNSSTQFEFDSSQGKWIKKDKQIKCEITFNCSPKSSLLPNTFPSKKVSSNEFLKYLESNFPCIADIYSGYMNMGNIDYKIDHCLRSKIYLHLFGEKWTDIKNLDSAILIIDNKQFKTLDGNTLIAGIIKVDEQTIEDKSELTLVPGVHEVQIMIQYKNTNGTLSIGSSIRNIKFTATSRNKYCISTIPNSEDIIISDYECQKEGINDITQKTKQIPTEETPIKNIQPNITMQRSMVSKESNVVRDPLNYYPWSENTLQWFFACGFNIGFNIGDLNKIESRFNGGLDLSFGYNLFKYIGLEAGFGISLFSVDDTIMNALKIKKPDKADYYDTSATIYCKLSIPIGLRMNIPLGKRSVGTFGGGWNINLIQPNEWHRENHGFYWKLGILFDIDPKTHPLLGFTITGLHTSYTGNELADVYNNNAKKFTTRNNRYGITLDIYLSGIPRNR